MITRRQLISSIAASTLIIQSAGGATAADEATQRRARNAAQLLSEFIGDASRQSGRIQLNLDEVQENGFSVPVSIDVTSPMTSKDYVSQVLLVAEQNPDPAVIRATFTPASGKASLTTRIRLARTQRLTAVAKMNTGDVYVVSKRIQVTVGGCGA